MCVKFDRARRPRASSRDVLTKIGLRRRTVSGCLNAEKERSNIG
jgi:hypothetical protein